MHFISVKFHFRNDTSYEKVYHSQVKTNTFDYIEFTIMTLHFHLPLLKLTIAVCPYWYDLR